MLRTIQLAALPSTLQLCLRSAVECNGLDKMYRMRVADQRVMSVFYRSRDGSDVHSSAHVESLLALGLLMCTGTSNSRVLITPCGVELLNAGCINSEVAA